MTIAEDMFSMFNTFFWLVFAVIAVFFVLFFILMFWGMIRASRDRNQAPSMPQQSPPEKEIIREIVKIRCPYCGNLYDEGQNKCPTCGAAR
jgi:Na+/H+ antiporter NhaC